VRDKEEEIQELSAPSEDRIKILEEKLSQAENENKALNATLESKTQRID